MADFTAASLGYNDADDNDKDPVLLGSFDEIFDQLIDADSYELSDNNRSTSDEWENYFDVPDSTSEGDAIGENCPANILVSSSRGRPPLTLATTAQSPRMAQDTISLRGSWDSSSDVLNDLFFPGIESWNKPASPPSTLQATIPKHRKSYCPGAPRSAGVHKRRSVSPKMAHATTAGSAALKQPNQRVWDPWSSRTDNNNVPHQAFNFGPAHHAQSISPPPGSAALPTTAWRQRQNPYDSASATTTANDATYGPLSAPYTRTPASGFDSSSSSSMQISAHAHISSPLSSPVLEQQMSPTATGYLRSPTGYQHQHYNDEDTAFSPPADAPWEDYPQQSQGYASFGQMVQFDPLAQPYPPTPVADHANRDHPPPPHHFHSIPHRGRPTNSELDGHYPGHRSEPSLEFAGLSSSNRFAGSSPHLQPQQQSRYDIEQQPRPRHPSQQQNHSAHNAQRIAMIQRFPEPSASPPPQTSPPRSRKGSRGPSTHHRRSKTCTGVDRVRTKESSVKSLDFVNYTPDDSRKILTGVAPSGSSKTKARREKEAADKRRRMSQAAVKAIRNLGGGLEDLERAFSQT